MITPNKFTSFRQSVVSQFPVILAAIGDETTLDVLYQTVGKKFADLNDFILALDALFILGKIEIDQEMGTVRHVG